ncbi:MAG: hypothetical protein ACI9LN_003308, partial [Saprospiraceae bacterium]
MDEKQVYKLLNVTKELRHKAKVVINVANMSMSAMEPTTLIAAVNVRNGELTNAHLQPTRDEQDFGNFIKETVSILPKMDKIVILSDQLNTHLSETLARFIAEEGGYTQGDLGVK